MILENITREEVVKALQIQLLGTSSTFRNLFTDNMPEWHKKLDRLNNKLRSLYYKWHGSYRYPWFFQHFFYSDWEKFYKFSYITYECVIRDKEKYCKKFNITEADIDIKSHDAVNG